MSTPRQRRAGFTLLEVLVAVSILGLGLTVILSSQVGLFSSSQRAENLSLATHLARCRMNETEVELLKEGYPVIDETKDEGSCCEDESESRFRCSWLIQRIELPQPAGEGAAPVAAAGRRQDRQRLDRRREEARRREGRDDRPHRADGCRRAHGDRAIACPARA